MSQNGHSSSRAFSIGLGLAAAFVAFSADAAPTLNLPQALADTAQILSSGGTADVLVLGDSLSVREGSYLPPFVRLMQQRFGNAGAGYQGHSLWSGSGFDNGWSGGVINGDVAPHHALDGLWSSSVTGPPINGSFQDHKNKTIQLHYLAGPDGGTFDVHRANWPNVTTVQTINTFSPTPEVRSWTYTHVEGENRVWYKPNGDGRVTILGSNNLADTPGLRFHRGANGGWGVQNFLQRSWTFDEQVRLLSTDLVFVWLGQNDQADTRFTYAQKVTQLTDRLKAAVPDAEIVLVGSYDVGSPVIPQLNLAMEDVAAAKGYGYVSMHELGGTNDWLKSQGFIDPDQIHFSMSGGDHFGQVLFNTISPNLPEPGTATIALGALTLLARRRKRP